MHVIYASNGMHSRHKWYIFHMTHLIPCNIWRKSAHFKEKYHSAEMFAEFYSSIMSGRCIIQNKSITWPMCIRIACICINYSVPSDIVVVRGNKYSVCVVNALRPFSFAKWSWILCNLNFVGVVFLLGRSASGHRVLWKCYDSNGVILSVSKQTDFIRIWWCCTFFREVNMCGSNWMWLRWIYNW